MHRTPPPALAPRALLLTLPLYAVLAASAAASSGGDPVARSWVDKDFPVVVRKQHAFAQAPDVFPLQIGGARWTYESDGTWIAEVASLGNHGTQVFTQHGDYVDVVPLLSAHDADPPQPIWEDGFVEINFHRAVDSAEESDSHVAMHQRFVAGSTQWREAVIRTYDSESMMPRWEAVLPTPIASHPHTAVQSSRDGSTIAAFVYDPTASSVKLTVFGADSATPVATGSVGSFGAFLGVTLSADGSTAVVLSSQKLSIVDVATATTIHEEFLFGPTVYGSFDLSGDGKRFAFGVDSGVRVYERDDLGAWSHTWTHALPAGAYCRRLAISHDGSKLALGANFAADLLASRVEALDLETQAMTMSNTVVGTGTLQNQVADVDMSDDGRFLAVGLWGDEPGDVPELLVYRSGVDEPFQVEDLEGSAQDVDLSGDGRRLVVASKGTHANIWGGGGAVRLFDIGVLDLEIQGVPRAGASVSVLHRVRPGGAGRLYVSPSLADAPLEQPDLGPGLLFLDPNAMTSLGDADGDDTGLVATTYDIPTDAQAGSTLYFQALGLDGTGFTRRWVAMTVLP